MRLFNIFTVCFALCCADCGGEEKPCVVPGGDYSGKGVLVKHECPTDSPPTVEGPLNLAETKKDMKCGPLAKKYPSRDDETLECGCVESVIATAEPEGISGIITVVCTCAEDGPGAVWLQRTSNSNKCTDEYEFTATLKEAQ